ncbi:hypothetical protein GQ53DRAFT_30875 [Thozetella sp. PMI_491]|nr:hypothetical protein GQ53DRAFT_30875 [Thozetella sp. PMI_491]
MYVEDRYARPNRGRHARSGTDMEHEGQIPPRSQPGSPVSSGTGNRRVFDREMQVRTNRPNIHTMRLSLAPKEGDGMKRGGGPLLCVQGGLTEMPEANIGSRFKEGFAIAMAILANEKQRAITRRYRLMHCHATCVQPTLDAQHQGRRTYVRRHTDTHTHTHTHTFSSSLVHASLGTPPPPVEKIASRPP